ncbi:hypothetical protein M8C21_009357 [Ambrosia artemisiifolia]|uniref:EngB-type G domain-containing protein n=1 Tax=Ambrosia artemisiifolia TaxID=4212 RepID=A0AAD5GHJ3_AMBAR|nr:hypothetical protein M8C21_009357 [Ambrosia artemisiifolia]
MLMPSRLRLFTHSFSSLFPPPPSSPSSLYFKTFTSNSTSSIISSTKPTNISITNTTKPIPPQTILFIPPGIDPDQVTPNLILPGSNIVLGPYAGDAKVKEVQFVGSSVRPKDCPKDDRPEFAMLGRSNVGKSSLINSLVRKKEVALTSKKPGKTQLINHFLVNRSWTPERCADVARVGWKNVIEHVNVVLMWVAAPCDVNAKKGPWRHSTTSWCGTDGNTTPLLRHRTTAPTFRMTITRGLRNFANAPEATRMDWSAFTKGYFLNRDSLVSVLLLVDASVPPQKIDLDCANWLGRNNIPMTIVFTKCDKVKNSKGRRPDENIKSFQELIKENYKIHPPWIMTSSATGLGHGLCFVGLLKREDGLVFMFVKSSTRVLHIGLYNQVSNLEWIEIGLTFVLTGFPQMFQQVP